MELRQKIINEITSKEVFLQKEVVEEEKPSIYLLEEEFTKAQENKDRKPYMIFFSFVGFLVLLTIIIASCLEIKSKQISIDISDFEDLQLKEIIIDVIQQEQELNRKNQELEYLRANFSKDLQKYKDKTSREQSKKQTSVEEDAYKKENEYLKQRVELLQAGLNKLLDSQNALGCILDPAKQNIQLYIPKKKISQETIVKVYRLKDEYVGKLKLMPTENQLRVEVLELAKNESLKALDWFK